ncbi:DNA-binding transcriptional response regulator, NtrC family, contains REC, AAA-type ATPase, and a Fis-type DNA-binding domains [Lishizhenia tianjinensis]|uniref:DNA-binding transcriptional response regulator, NtrC family, contains REC, AAA-type ATPase, and a Fis-type DNA-binding domains n=1 Tax=Lishizhenia tianjinensis TaxID=477690 RepID=A0A1I6ZUJ7_9FLAO|nr:sigma-54 dependent transcriptional regulator [Lishizhenia tianjinensis]SFT66285.1 DNA-binding transcriptional response regulator, NtrC family, contains REC, AAA-type ATPase, and a Fis-type DNA-binding domains [Lishizhenia tianjinensis]
MSKILIIDDEKSIRRALREILEFEDFEVDEAENGKEGVKLATQQYYDIIFCDIKMPLMDGMEVLEAFRKEKVLSPVIMISGHGNIETAVEAIKNGAFDFIEKPLDLNRILVTIRNAKDKSSLVEEKEVLKKTVRKFKGSSIIGETPEILTIKEMIEKVGPSEARVLITGENGTGKELVARSLHDNSPRKEETFIEVNCAAIPAELIESELFGHEKGSFTSAVKQKKGKFELASKGTLFLDEIGDMSASAQAKVLRALQENTIQRVGGEKNIKVNCRVLAATNKDLRKEIEAGNFREDLYHRLSVILMHVPSLNERKDDIPLLAEHFMTMVCAEHGIPRKKFSDAALKALQEVNWTGNIRELRNITERLIILCGDEISAEDIATFANPKK